MTPPPAGPLSLVAIAVVTAVGKRSRRERNGRRARAVKSVKPVIRRGLAHALARSRKLRDSPLCPRCGHPGHRERFRENEASVSVVRSRSRLTIPVVEKCDFARFHGTSCDFRR